jgi:hypothetical protein
MRNILNREATLLFNGPRYCGEKIQALCLGHAKHDWRACFHKTNVILCSMCLRPFKFEGSDSELASCLESLWPPTLFRPWCEVQICLVDQIVGDGRTSYGFVAEDGKRTALLENARRLWNAYTSVDEVKGLGGQDQVDTRIAGRPVFKFADLDSNRGISRKVAFGNSGEFTAGLETCDSIPAFGKRHGRTASSTADFENVGVRGKARTVQDRVDEFRRVAGTKAIELGGDAI